MTLEEREAEAERLMALLNGEGDALMIDEAGGTKPPEPLSTRRRSCEMCFRWLDDDESPSDGLAVCDDCRPEYEVLMKQQVVCQICSGKRLIFQGTGRGWQDCIICSGRGWVDGVTAQWNEWV
jgi:hypothetical protein